MSVGIVGVHDRCLKIDLPVVSVLLAGGCKDAVQVNGNSVGHRQMHITVDATAAIPPALKMLAIDIHRKHVLAIKIDIVADIHLKRVISGIVARHQTAVEINDALPRDPVKAQKYPHPFSRPLRESEVTTIPGVVIVQIPQRVVFIWVVVLIYHIVVRQVDPHPQIIAIVAPRPIGVGLVEIGIRCRTGQISLGLALRIHRSLVLRHGNVNVPFVKPPALVQQLVFAHTLLRFSQYKDLMYNYNRPPRICQPQNFPSSSLCFVECLTFLPFHGIIDVSMT